MSKSWVGTREEGPCTSPPFLPKSQCRIPVPFLPAILPALLPAAFDGDVLYIQRLRRILQRQADVMDRREGHGGREGVALGHVAQVRPPISVFLRFSPFFCAATWKCRVHSFLPLSYPHSTLGLRSAAAGRVSAPSLRKSLPRPRRRRRCLSSMSR